MTEQQNKPSDKELNFRALEARYQQLLEENNRKIAELETKLKQTPEPEEEDESSDPYVDERKLKKHLQKFGEQTVKQTQSEIQKAVQQAIYEERKQNWMKNNSEFYDVMKQAEKLAIEDPELAETILQMPDTFERQKLVYRNIKAMRLHEEKKPEPTVEELIQRKKQNAFYQPSMMASPGHSAVGDYSPQGQKEAYEKLQQLKSRLRL